MTPAGVRTTLVSFTSTGPVPGHWPRATLLRTSDGALYGTTSQGGTDGAGTVFRYRPDTRQFTSMAFFSGQSVSTPGGAKGRTPTGALVDGGDGSIYGTTRYGGATGNGTVFRLAKAGGAVQTLAEFTGTTGSTRGGGPLAGLTPYFPIPFQPAAAFYGVTVRGGTGDSGTLFSITPTGTLTTLVEFTGGSGPRRGAEPQGELVWKNDRLYGTTQSGGLLSYGTVFRFDPGISEFTVLADLGSSAPGNWHGRYPLAGLTLANDGRLYGTTSTGLAESGLGGL